MPGLQQSRCGNTHSLHWADPRKEAVSFTLDTTRSPGATKNFQKSVHGGFPEHTGERPLVEGHGGHSDSKHVHGKSWLVVQGKALIFLIKVPLKALVSTREEGRSWFMSSLRTVSEDFLARISWFG